MRILRRGSTRSKERVYRAVVSSQRGHMLLHHYLWRQEEGVEHLFALEETLELQGEYVLWPRR